MTEPAEWGDAFKHGASKTPEMSHFQAIRLLPDSSNWSEVREFLIDGHYAYDVECYGEDVTGYTGVSKYTDYFIIHPGQWVVVTSRNRGTDVVILEEVDREV